MRHTIKPGFGKRIGNRWAFALEFEIHDDPPARAWNERWGSLWLWAEGHLVGRPYETEMIQIGLDSLQETATENRTLASSILSACSSKESLEAVMWARYGGDDSPPITTCIGNEERLFSLEVLPRRTGPFFDGWEAILLEKGAKECLIYRQEGADAAEVILPLGTFRNVIGDARREFERLARSLLNGTTAIS